MFLLALTEMSQHCLIDVLISNNPVFVSTSTMSLYFKTKSEQFVENKSTHREFLKQ